MQPEVTVPSIKPFCYFGCRDSATEVKKLRFREKDMTWLPSPLPLDVCAYPWAALANRNISWPGRHVLTAKTENWFDNVCKWFAGQVAMSSGEHRIEAPSASRESLKPLRMASSRERRCLINKASARHPLTMCSPVYIIITVTSANTHRNHVERRVQDPYVPLIEATTVPLPWLERP